jgi:hypothetical protein
MRIQAAICLASVLSACGPDTPESCDLDKTFSTSKQDVFCIETAVATSPREAPVYSGAFLCTCPDDSTFQASDVCAKDQTSQGDLIESACPVPSDSSAAEG